MAEPNRRDLLQRLQRDMEGVEPADERSQQILADARAQVQRALDDDDHEALPERLQDALYHFEATHPDLARALTVVIDSLSNMGL